MLKSNKASSYIFVTAIALYCFFAIKFWFVCDDAYISFRYSKNLAEGYGLRYNIANEIPVEGYSNFLWVVLGAVFELLGLKIDFWMPLISLISGILILINLRQILLFFKLEKHVVSLAVLMLALFPPFFVWATSGMATIPFLLLWLLSFKNLIITGNPVRAGIYALLMSLIRAEGIAWALFIAGLAFLKTDFRKLFTRYLPIVIAGFSIYFLWRYNYFQELKPNTVTNKVGFNETVFARGWKYTYLYYLTFVTPFLIPFGLVASYLINKKLFIPLLLSALVTTVYPVLIGGDFMTMFRFFAPLFLVQTLIFAFLIELIHRAFKKKYITYSLALIMIITALLPAFNQHLVPESYRKNFHIRLNTAKFRSEYRQWVFMKNNTERWRELGLGMKKISQPGDSLVAGAIGNLGYYSELHIYDRFGLVEPRVAKREVRKMKKKSPGHDKAVRSTFFIADEPTYLKAYILRDPDMNKINARIASYKTIPAYKNYEPLFVDLEKQDSKGQKLALLVLKRK